MNLLFCPPVKGLVGTAGPNRLLPPVWLNVPLPTPLLAPVLVPCFYNTDNTNKINNSIHKYVYLFNPVLYGLLLLWSYVRLVSRATGRGGVWRGLHLSSLLLLLLSSSLITGIPVHRVTRRCNSRVGSRVRVVVVRVTRS